MEGNADILLDEPITVRDDRAALGGLADHQMGSIGVAGQAPPGKRRESTTLACMQEDNRALNELQ
jgi:hypothetical protein